MDAELIPGLPEEIARECLVRVPFDLFSTVRTVCRLWRREIDSSLFHWIRKSENLTRKVVALAQAEPAVESEGPAHKYYRSATTPTYRLTLFDPAGESWRTLPPLPGVSHGLPLFCQIAAAHKKLVVVGGWDPETWAPSDGVYIYDFLLDAWSRGTRMPGPRRSFFACSSSPSAGTIFVAGGHDEEKNALRSAMAYDVARDEWSQLPDMARERDECKGVFVGGRFEVVGGYSTDRQGQFGRCAEAFDVSEWRWNPVEEDRLEVATCPRTCVADGEKDGKLYMVRSGHLAVKEEGGKWREVAEVPEDAAVAAQLVKWEGKLLLLLGAGCHGGAQVGYLLEAAAGTDDGYRTTSWQKVKVPEEFSGLVQAICCIEV